MTHDGDYGRHDEIGGYVMYLGDSVELGVIEKRGDLDRALIRPDRCFFTRIISSRL